MGHPHPRLHVKYSRRLHVLAKVVSDYCGVAGITRTLQRSTSATSLRYSTDIKNALPVNRSARAKLAVGTGQTIAYDGNSHGFAHIGRTSGQSGEELMAC